MRWLLLIGLLGCDSCDQPEAAPTPVGAHEPQEEPTPPQHEPAPLGSLGMEVPIPVLTQAAREANRAALEKHSAGDYESSRDGFLESLAALPTYDAARFNLACAYGRLGDHAAAARELDRLLRRDLARYRTKLDDEDLAATMASSEGETLRATIRELSEPWSGVVAGIPSLANGRFGFYVREHERFFTMTAQSVEGHSVANVAQRKIAWMVTEYVDGYDAWFGVEGVHVETFMPESEHSWSRTHYAPGTWVVWSFMDATDERVRFNVDGEWQELRGRRLVTSSDQSERGLAAHERPPEGFRLRGNTLEVPDGEPIELERGHGAAKWHSFAINETRTRIFIASELETEPQFEGMELYLTQHKTVFDHVNLETREVHRLGRGDSAGYVFAFGNEAYLVGLDGSRRHPTFEPNEYEPMPVTPIPPG